MSRCMAALWCIPACVLVSLAASCRSTAPSVSAGHDASGAASALERELIAARSELDRFNLETRDLMRALLAAGVRHAERSGDRWPERSSDLRGTLGPDDYAMLMAPYDRTPEVLELLAGADDPWAWLDEHGSFEWHGGRHDFDHRRVVLSERRPHRGIARWVLFADGHIEFVSGGGVLDAALHDAGMVASGR